MPQGGEGRWLGRKPLEASAGCERTARDVNARGIGAPELAIAMLGETWTRMSRFSARVRKRNDFQSLNVAGKGHVGHLSRHCLMALQAHQAAVM